PENGIEFAKRAIGLDSIPISANNETARKVQKAFEEHVSQSNIYQVLIVPASEMDIAWSVVTERSGIYTNITNFNGIDIHVFRFKKSELSEKSANADRWFTDKQQAIQKRIKLNVLMDTSTVLSDLHSDSSIGPIYAENVFRSVILLKNKHTSDKKTEIPIGLATSVNASRTIEMTRSTFSIKHPLIETRYTWNTLFFL
ncbi:hypothetical protein PENTCL1PPCAC_894, partial [Pristionchus entomophagus]